MVSIKVTLPPLQPILLRSLIVHNKVWAREDQGMAELIRLHLVHKDTSRKRVDPTLYTQIEFKR